MGQQPPLPNKAETQENGYNHEEENDDESSDDDMTQEEFEALSNKMDEVNSVLDSIEQKNDVIYNELLRLLEANREIRQQMQNIPGQNKPNEN